MLEDLVAARPREWREMFTLITAATLAAAALAPSQIPVPDPGSPTSSAASEVSTAGWGVNQSGWNVIIENATSGRLALSHGWFSNVAHADHAIGALTINENTRGMPSIFGGPANMDLTISQDGKALTVLYIDSDVFSSTPRVRCDIAAGYTCKVEAPSVESPVKITVRKLG